MGTHRIGPLLGDQDKEEQPASVISGTLDFIGACGALHQRLAQGSALTLEEVDLIEFSALDLLNNVKPLD